MFKIFNRLLEPRKVRVRSRTNNAATNREVKLHIREAVKNNTIPTQIKEISLAHWPQRNTKIEAMTKKPAKSSM